LATEFRQLDLWHRQFTRAAIILIALAGGLSAPLASANISDSFDRANSAAIGNGWIEKEPSAFSIQTNAVAKLASYYDYRDNIVYRPAAEDVADVEASVEMRVTASDPGYPQLHTRIQSSTVATSGWLDSYTIYVNGSNTEAVLGRQRGSSFVTTLASFTLSPALNTADTFRLRLRATGTNPVQLEAFVERLQGASWQIIGQATASDSNAQRIATAGSVGFSGYIESGYRFDNFVRTNLGTGTPNPVPALTGISPTSATAGESGLILTLNGSGFAAGSEVRWNGAARATTFVSSTILEAAIPASDLAAEGSATVTVFNPAPGGGLSGGQTFTIQPAVIPNPVPVATALSPASAAAGGSAFTLTVTGSSFATGAVVRWNGSNRTTTFISPTEVRAAIGSADIAAAGTASVTVFNPAPGGGISGALNFTISAAPNPVPTIGSLNPSSRTAGSGAFTLTVNGTNFVAGAVVRWNGANRTTTFVSATSLTAAITAADVQTAGTASVTVFNPAPGGGVSGAVNFTIDAAPNPLPTIGSLSPSSRAAGSGAFTLTVTGTNYVAGSVVRWNGSSRTTTFGSSTSLTAAITATDVQSAGTATVTVFNPAPGGGTSGGATFTITSGGGGSLSISSLSPISAIVGSTSVLVTVTGSGFTTSSVVRWNGAARPTTYVSATQVRANIPGSDLLTDSIAAVTVLNGSTASAPLSFFVLPATDSVFFDGFNRGPAQDLGNGWVEKTPSAFEILTNGTVWAADTYPLDFHDTIVYRNAAELQLDSETGVEFVRLSGGRFPQLHARVQMDSIAQADTLESYILYVEDGISPQGLAIAVQPPATNVGECIIRIAAFPTLPQVGQRYRLRLQVRGTYPVQLTGIMEWFNGGAWEPFVSASIIHDANTVDPRWFCPYPNVPSPISDAGSSGFAKWFDPTDGYDNFFWRSMQPGQPVNNIPAVTSMSPTTVVAGSNAFTLAVNGSNFSSGSTVRWNGADRPTTFLSGTQLQAQITAADVASAGTATVTVFNSGPGGGISPTGLGFTITTPPPSNPGLQFSDDFARANSPTIGNGWNEKEPGAFSIENGQARKLASYYDYRDNVVYRPASEALLDTEVSSEFRITNLAVGYPQLFARLQSSTVGIYGRLDGYVVYFNSSTSQAILGRQVGTSFVTTLATLNLTTPLNTADTFRMRLRVTGTTTVQLQAYVERLTGGAWVIVGQATASDSSSQRIAGAGVAGFSGYIENYYAFDNFSVFNLTQ